MSSSVMGCGAGCANVAVDDASAMVRMNACRAVNMAVVYLSPDRSMWCLDGARACLAHDGARPIPAFESLAVDGFDRHNRAGRNWRQRCARLRHDRAEPQRIRSRTMRNDVGRHALFG